MRLLFLSIVAIAAMAVVALAVAGPPSDDSSDPFGGANLPSGGRVDERDGNSPSDSPRSFWRIDAELSRA